MSTSCVDSPARLYKEEEHSHAQAVQGKQLLFEPLCPRQEDTVFLIDWDDTLLASSWLAENGLRLDSKGPLSPEAQEQLQVLEQAIISLINKALEYGEVHLVTNAELGWIELSAQKFVPGVLQLLSKVEIISARTTFEHMFPNQPRQWKIEAFKHQLSNSFVDEEMMESKTQLRQLNIVSFGDSVHEREALLCVTGDLPNALAKSVKFVERPSIDQLHRQLEMIHGCIDHIATFNGNLDLMLTVQLLMK